MMSTKPEKDYDESLVSTDQTVFGAEEALMEGSFVPVAPSSLPATTAPSPRWHTWLALAGGLGLMLAGIGIWSLLGSTPQNTNQIIDNQVEPSPVAETKWSRLLRNLEVDLQAGDPARPGFTFPQVDLKLQLDDPKL